MKVEKLNRKQACQIFYLSIFDFILKHIPGTKIGKVNKLSRRLDWEIGIEKDNKNQTLIKEQWIYSLAELVIEGLEVDIIEKMKIAREKDKEVGKVVEEVKNYVLKNEEQKVEII